jgi:DNA-binding NarL/FixJ family response regulator
MPKGILIVDDSDVIRTSVRHFLKYQPGLEVCGEAVDGFDALEKARKLTPDLVILDLPMPRMNGLQAARLLRDMIPSMPIILFTVFADSIRPDDFEAAGVSVVVSKDDLVGLQHHIDRLLVSPQ